MSKNTIKERVLNALIELNKKGKNVGLPKYTHDYIARLDIKGTIQEKNETYNQAWLLDTIDCLINDDKNKGLFIFVDSPGGTVYEADELYLKLCEYKESGRPIYAYFAHMAASGGYYIGCAADYIMTNRNCTTGSIGVIAGQFIDITELLDMMIANHICFRRYEEYIGDDGDKEEMTFYEIIVGYTNVGDDYLVHIVTAENVDSPEAIKYDMIHIKWLKDMINDIGIDIPDSDQFEVEGENGNQN